MYNFNKFVEIFFVDEVLNDIYCQTTTPGLNFKLCKLINIDNIRINIHLGTRKANGELSLSK
jgi:hypothetical protein